MRLSTDRRTTGESPCLARLFGRFTAIYGLIWTAVLIGFAGVSYPFFEDFAKDQSERGLRTNAALAEEYISAIGAYSKAYRPVLEQICRRLSQPGMLNARVTVFSPRSEIIADSRSGNPLAVKPAGGPEVEAALGKEVGTSIRYSRSDRKRMAFAAYPHVHLGKVESVIRIGIPYASFASGLWRAYAWIAAAGLGLSIVAAALSSLFIFYRPGERQIARWDYESARGAAAAAPTQGR